MVETAYSDTRFDRFLCAPLFEQDGMTVSVLSALARLDLDPWAEAARLAELAKYQAVNSLAATIWKGNSDRWSAMEASLEAERLIGLLPVQREPAGISIVASDLSDHCAIWLAYGVALAMIALSSGNPQQTAATPVGDQFATATLHDGEAAPLTSHTNLDWLRGP
jgi:hypothetical protein